MDYGHSHPYIRQGLPIQRRNHHITFPRSCSLRYSLPFSRYSSRETAALPYSNPDAHCAAPRHASSTPSPARRTTNSASLGSNGRKSRRKRSSKPWKSVLPPVRNTSRSSRLRSSACEKRWWTMSAAISTSPAWSIPAIEGLKTTSGTRMRSTFRCSWCASRWLSGSNGHGPRRKAWIMLLVQSDWAARV